LGIDYNEKTTRHDVSNNLIPITNISGAYDLSRDILQIFANDFQMSKTDIAQLSLIISEMFCNTTIHSKSKGGAYLYCQKYRKSRNSLEFILVDSGIGIKKSLQKNMVHQNITNKEAVSSAIRFGVTCGEGRGHGLYFASEFVKRNNGEMVLISGDERIVIKNNTVNSITNNHWNGVYLKFLFKFDSQISLDELMREKKYDINLKTISYDY
jgi:anti-sigma regulatory factor (Ser/Thr protein kinase)